MALTFHSGFEMGDFNEWASTTGSPTVQTSIKKTGAYAMRCNTSAATAYVDEGSIWHNKATFYLYIASAPDAETIILGENVTSSNIRLTSTRYLKFYYQTTLEITGSTQLAVDTWYRISFLALPGDTKLYIDGVQEGSSAAANYVVKPILGVSSSVTADLYFDDYAGDDSISTDSLGDIQVELSQPNVVGNYNEFDNLVPSATHYENVDNIPQDANVDNDYNEIQATGTYRDSYGIENSSTIGLGGSDTIEAVSIWARMMRNGGGGTDHMIMVRDNGSDYNTSNLAVNGSFTWFNKHDTDLPNGGGAWTQGRFDAFEVGVYRSGAQDQSVSNMQVMVAYTPVVVGAQWKQVQYTSEPPTTNAWNQIKHTTAGGWNQIKFEGE